VRERERERNSAVFRRGALLALGAIAAGVLCYCVWLLRHVALIFALAVFWAYFLAWPARWLARRMPYKRAIRIVFYTSFLVILGTLGPIGTMLYRQCNELIQKLPGMAAQLEQSISGWHIELLPGQTVHLDESLTATIEQLRQNAPALLSKAFNASQSFLTGTAEVVAALIIIPLISFYLLLDTTRLRSTLVDLFPPRLRSDIQQVLSAVNSSFGTYIYSRVILSFFAGLMTLVLLLVLQVPFSLVLALLAVVGEFIPVVGPAIVLVFACLIALATGAGAGGWVAVFWILIGFGIIRFIQDYVVSPRLMGETMDIHPLTVVGAMLMGGTLGGFAGLLLAIPAAAALKVIFNVFVLRRPEKGVKLPALDLIGGGEGAVDFREALVPSLEPPDEHLDAEQDRPATDSPPPADSPDA
jgi:predicted PurR-regulated permease PerM